MIQQNLDRYTELTNRIVELPDLVALAERELTELKQTHSAEKKMLEELGEVVIDEAMRRAGDKWGSNADIRKKSAATALASSPEYVKQERKVESIEGHVKRQENHVSDLNRQYGAVCFQITHHAALLQYLGSAGAGMPVPEKGWSIAAAAVEFFANNEISEEEIAAIGF